MKTQIIREEVGRYKVTIDSDEAQVIRIIIYLGSGICCEKLIEAEGYWGIGFSLSPEEDSSWTHMDIWYVHRRNREIQSVRLYRPKTEFNILETKRMIRGKNDWMRPYKEVESKRRRMLRPVRL